MSHKQNYDPGLNPDLEIQITEINYYITIIITTTTTNNNNNNNNNRGYFRWWVCE